MRYGLKDRTGRGCRAGMQGEEGESSGDAPIAEGRRWKSAVRWALGVVAMLCLVLLALWTQRQPLAENFIERELNRLGVRADYRIAAIGLRTQRIDHVVLGYPASPDLTADWVEVDIALSGVTPQVAAVRAGGVRLRGSLRGGVLDLGSLNAFRDPASTAPFALPDVRLGLRDARMRLDTDFGPVGLKLDGDGNLRSGFRGKLAAVMPQAAIAGCTASRATAYVDLGVSDGRPRLSGPVRADTLRCDQAGVTLVKPRFHPDILLSSQFDRWTGSTAIAADRLVASGARLSRLTGRISLDGTAARTQGRLRLSGADARSAAVTLARADLDGAWTFGGDGMTLNGALSGQTLRVGGSDPLGGLRASTAGTPVAPLARGLADALRAASADNHFAARFALARRGAAGSVVLTALTLSSRSGARVGLGQGARFTLNWPTGQWVLDGGATMAGGGLPRAALRLTQRPGGGLGGQAFIDPYGVGGAKLMLEPVRFVAEPGGATRFATHMTLDGPLPGGALKGLALPVEGSVAADGAIRVNRNCAPLSFTSLDYAGTTLGRTKLTLCPVGGALLSYGRAGLGGGGTIARPRLTGRIGTSPLRFAAQSAGFTLAGPGFQLRDADIALGPQDSPVRMTAASLSGTAAGQGLGGRIEGASARIGAVPLLVGDTNGTWGFAGGLLRLDAALVLTDAANPDRFEPLTSRDFRLDFRDSRITAQGSLHEPKTGATVATVAIAHDLRTARGSAALVVPGLTFTAALQPEMVSRLALGVVANARGTVTGRGQVRWNGSSVTSDGLFRTDAMDLAAAFGPVTGLSGEIRFTDLVNLITAPHQTMRIATVNPGTEVTDGVVHYQLIDGQRVRIEDGTWPFSGGTLTLLPSTLDFAADKSRLLSFRVVGLDAGAFIQTLDLQNISATGTFDGVLPMIFDATGGRIKGGLLVARQTASPPLILTDAAEQVIPCDPKRQAGNLAYVGPVSNEQLGVFGKLAFDALKNLQYKCLTILMDGALDGEVVTQVSFNGVNRSPLGGVPNGIARNFIGLPFLFNIRIEAPFRGLLNTASSFTNPGQLIRSRLGDRDAPATTIIPGAQLGIAVQPAESDKKASGGQK